MLERCPFTKDSWQIKAHIYIKKGWRVTFVDDSWTCAFPYSAFVVGEFWWIPFIHCWMDQTGDFSHILRLCIFVLIRAFIFCFVFLPHCSEYDDDYEDYRHGSADFLARTRLLEDLEIRRLEEDLEITRLEEFTRKVLERTRLAELERTKLEEFTRKKKRD